MARGMTSACVALLALLLVIVSPAVQGAIQVYSYDDLVGAINLANENAKTCEGKKGCLGEPVEAIINAEIILTGELPPVKTNAFFKATGNCTANKGSRCLIDGKNEYRVFPSGAVSAFPTGNPGRLELRRLLFERAKGGVLYNTYCVVLAVRCIFRSNIDGVVINMGFFGGAPLQTFINCGFFNNNGTAITAGNGKLGLAEDGHTGFVIRRCVFRNNAGKDDENDSIFYESGGAIAVAGFGTTYIEKTFFGNNVARSGGGAIFADQTNVVLKEVSFFRNIAFGGGGGAVLGQCGVYQNTSVSFCNCTFDSNTAPTQPEANSLLFRTYTQPDKINRVDVHFCDTEIPEGSVFEPEPHGSVTVGFTTNGTCSYC